MRSCTPRQFTCLPILRNCRTLSLSWMNQTRYLSSRYVRVTSLHFTYLSRVQCGRTQCFDLVDYGMASQRSDGLLERSRCRCPCSGRSRCHCPRLTGGTYLVAGNAASFADMSRSDGAKSGRDRQVNLASWHIPLNEVQSRHTSKQDISKRLNEAKRSMQKAYLQHYEFSEKIVGQNQSSKVQLL